MSDPLYVSAATGIIPLPLAVVENGSVVVRHMWGLTRPHAIGRAVTWCARRGPVQVREGEATR